MTLAYGWYRVEGWSGGERAEHLPQGMTSKNHPQSIHVSWCNELGQGSCPFNLWPETHVHLGLCFGIDVKTLQPNVIDVCVRDVSARNLFATLCIQCQTTKIAFCMSCLQSLHDLRLCALYLMCGWVCKGEATIESESSLKGHARAQHHIETCNEITECMFATCSRPCNGVACTAA
jgi:hypothetical protein